MKQALQQNTDKNHSSKQNPNPEMLILAREVRGITQTELAEKSGIDQGRISRYEGGLKAIPHDELEVMANVLSFPTTFFYREGKRHGAETGELFHRKRRTSSMTQQKIWDGILNMRRLELNDLLDAIDQVAPYSIPKCDVDDFNGDIEQIAASVRSAWRMPSGPVSNIIAQLEAASCIVFAYSFDSDKIDEIVQWIEPTPPIILVNSNAPSDRLRFSLAHALGHLVMHHNRTPYPKMEEEADRFASAFLMPDEDIRAELTPVTIDHMLYLKPYWKVSMQALIRRARDIEVISERQYQSLFQMLSRVGYRRQEPVTISPEKPELIATILDLYRQELKYTDKELAELLRLNVSDFRAWYYPKPPHLTVLDKPKRLIE